MITNLRDGFKKIDPKTAEDGDLLMEFMDWIRIYRNESKLLDCERTYFKSLRNEIIKRGLLKLR